MQDADKGIAGASTGDLAGEGLRVAIVRARFNATITVAVEQACVDELLALKVDPRDITRVSVPGALEVPLALKALADAGDHDALVAIGCVIRGETYHFELVANESAAGVMRVALDHRVAIANAILTVDTQAQALARAKEKGIDAARVAIEMANVLEDLS